MSRTDSIARDHVTTITIISIHY